MIDLKLLDNYCKDIESFTAEIKKISAVILPTEQKRKAETLANTWTDCYMNRIESDSINNTVLKSVDNAFVAVLKLVRKNNRTTSYISKFELVNSVLFDKVFIPLRTKPKTDSEVVLSEYLDKLDSDENEYLNEAIGCYRHGYLKAAIVLGWCATIDRIHKKIEAISFEQFNSKALELKNQKDGRFRRFNKSYNINSISELREVFDSDLLWVIEGMGLIDINQHTRLSSCFDMRCHSGHPGEAPITKYNTVSFFSDIFEIVLVNDIFK